MPVTTRRPELPPNGDLPYAYIGGTIYYELNGTHPDLMQDLIDGGLPRSAVSNGIYGRIYNWGEEDNPRYQNELYSDFYPSNVDPDMLADLQAKLDALFPGLESGELNKPINPFSKVAFYIVQPIDVSDIGKENPDWENGRIPIIVYNGLNEVGNITQRIFVGQSGGHHAQLAAAVQAKIPNMNVPITKRDSNTIFGFIDPKGQGEDEPAGYYFFNENGPVDADVIDSLKQNYGNLSAYGLYNAKTPQDYPEDGAYNGFFERLANVPKWEISAIISSMADMSPIDAAVRNDPAATTAIQALTAAGGRVFVVGGAVRDAILGSNPKDIDLMVQGLDDDQITDALENLGALNFTGVQFGVYRFRLGQSEVEIALPRTERSTGPGHNDFEVTTDPHLDPSHDLARRDFTGNAMAYEPQTGQLIDPFGGEDDLRNGKLNLVNDRAFEDDPLRIVRALVANARFGLEPTDQLKQALKDTAHRIKDLPGERIQMELDKLLVGSDPVKAVELAEESGLIPYLFPELEAAVGFDQMNPHHDLDVFSHTMKVFRKMTELSNDPDLRLAALFHDSGKPDSFWRDKTAPEGGGGHFYKKILDDGTVLGADHEDVGAEKVEAFMKRLRYPNNRIERVKKLVQFHMFPYFNSPKGARKFLNALGGDPKMAFDLLSLRESDASGKATGDISPYDREMIDKDRQLLQDVLESNDGITMNDLAVNGHDLMERGYKGPEIGKVKNKLLDLIIENPELNDRDTLLKILDEAHE